MLNVWKTNWPCVSLMFKAQSILQYYGNLGRYMCIDFIDLNKVFSKDNFSLSKIDRLLDSMASFEFLSLPNANLGYHEILVHPNDEEKWYIINQ